jgi:acyl-CoA dehydrogenase
VRAIAMTEPGTGSDLQSRAPPPFVTRRLRHQWIKDVHLQRNPCDLLIIVAKTDLRQGAKGISLPWPRPRTYPDRTRPGAEEDRNTGRHPNRRSPTCGCGEELARRRWRAGFHQLMKQQPPRTPEHRRHRCRMAEAAVVEAISYAKERQAFDQPILDYQNTKFVLAECKADVLAGKTLIDHCVQRCIDGTLDATTASMAKLWATEMQCKVVDKCLQIFGGYGYIMEYPIARMYASARVQKIYGGTNEIMKELIGRTL